MAVYTEVSETDLEDLLAAYNVGELLSCKGIAEGSENSNYFLHTTDASFILTLYERRVDPADLPFFLGLMEHLSQKGVNCPLPVRRRDGKVVSQIAGRPAALITFMDGMSIRRPTPLHCREVGKAMAGLHLAARDFPLARANDLTLPGWKNLWQKARDRADEVEPGLAAETQSDLAFLEAHWPADLPEGVIHADLFPDNVFFLGGRVSGIIDYYFSCNDWLAYDIATALNAWCFEKDGSYNLTKGTALLEGYQTARPLDPAEIAALPVLARGSALRFMLTRLYDWLTIPDGELVTKRDPMEYVRRLRFHRQCSAPGDYGIGIS